MTVRLQREDFDVGAEIARLSQGRTEVGAVASFTGICRGGDIAAMTLEHYPGMAPRSSGTLRRPKRAGRCSA